MKTMYKKNKADRLSPIAATIVVMALASSIYYLMYVLNPVYSSDFVLYLSMVIVEVYVVITAAFSWWTVLFHDKGQDLDPQKLSKQDFDKIQVAVIIPIYSEPLEMVEEAVIHAKSIDGVNDIYIGDDGNRDEVADLAEKYGVHHYPRVSNDHFKSGNIANILKNIDHEFVAVFDVDHKAEPNFLYETLPYFTDTEVGFVQTPQYYTNTNNLISKGASGAQNIFYELIMPGKNSFNSAFCVGTNVIYRKKALDTTFDDGFYLANHSEDIWTSLRMHEKGWKSVYVPEVLAKGLAPEDIDSFFRQQERWARGGYEILLKGNPLFSKKLTLEQKVQYFFSGLHYFSGFAILFYLLVPIIYLLTEHKPLVTDTSINWVLHFTPFFISKFLLIFYLMDQFDFSIISSSLALFPVYVKAFFKELLGERYNWITTNTKKESKSVYDYLYWHFFIIFLSVMAIIVGLLTVEERVTAYIFVGWTLVNTILLLHFVIGVLKGERKEEKSSTAIAVNI